MELALTLAGLATVLAGLGVELRLFAPGRDPRRGEAIAWSTGWLVLAVAVAAGIALAGTKILTSELVHISDLASLAIIGALLGTGVVASLAADHLDPPHPAEKATRRPPRCPEQLTPPASRA